MNNKTIKQELKSTLEKYVGQNVNDVLRKIRSDLQDVMDNLILSEPGVYLEDFPIEFENELGKWRFEKDGNCFVYPKMSSVAKINITIKPTGESYE